MRIRFLKAAQQEVDVAWYDEREEDLGRDFLDELDRVIELSPFRWLQLTSSLESEDVC